MKIGSGDVVTMVSTIAALEIIKWLFGFGVAMGVAVTAFIGCLAFLYHAGKDA